MAKKKVVKKTKINGEVMFDGVNTYHLVDKDKFKQVGTECVGTIEDWKNRGFILEPVECMEVFEDAGSGDSVPEVEESDGVSE